MDPADRQAIDDIFRRLEEVERSGAAPDPDAERMISDRVRQRPVYAYYLAQTVVAQQQALEAAQRRLDAAEGRGASQGRPQQEEGGFLSRMFGGGDRARTAVPASPGRDPRYAGHRPGMGGGGFLAGAAQTAMGVAGGVVLGSLLMNAFDGGGEAQAAEPEPEPADTAADDAGADDYGGDMGGGDFEF